MNLINTKLLAVIAGCLVLIVAFTITGFIVRAQHAEEFHEGLNGLIQKGTVEPISFPTPAP